MADVPDRLAAALSDRYRIREQIGVGGMATVYLADDLKHERRVAVKVLKPELAAVVGGDRFVAEIKTTANLSHPNILPLFDSGEADGFLYYVMPYVEGETLGDLLRREKQMAVAEAVRIGREVAEALDHAHRQGIVHRDVKPANILLQDGRPLVSDFGIALAVSQAGGGRLTETGLSMGTPHYMSPEQASGDRDVDPRADVYSLGCVLFEMLTGEPPYGGGTAQAVLARILTAEPDRPTSIRSTIPPNVEGTILKAMEKLPADRFESAAGFAEALTDPSFRYGAGAEETAGANVGPWRAAALAAAALAVILPLLVFVLTRPSPPEPPSTIRSVWGARDGQEIRDLLAQVMSFSPDGSTLVYVGPANTGNQLWVRQRDRAEATPLIGTTGAEHPEVDPTGRWVAFLVGQQLRKAPLAGGPVVTLSDSVPTDIGSIAWLDNGQIAFNTTPRFQLALISEEGGQMRRLTHPDGEASITTAYSALPGGGFLFTACTSLCQASRSIWAYREDTGFVEVAPGFQSAWYVDSGHLVAVRTSGNVFALRFDPERLEVSGDPVPLFDGVEMDSRVLPDMEVGRSGRMLARRGGSGSETRQLVWISRDGVRTPVDPDFRYVQGTFVGLRISPDGGRVAFSRTTDDGTDVWIKELDDGPAYRVTYDESVEYRPAWYPDGDSLLFVSERQGGRDLFRRRANATGPVNEALDRPSDISQGVVSPDGAWLVYREGTADGRDIWAYRIDGDSAAFPLLAERQYDEKAPALSPDGRWIAYESEETGQNEIYVRPFPAVADGKWQISIGGGVEPVWARSGREVFYVRSDGVMMAAELNPGPPFRVESRTELFQTEMFGTTQDHTTYDVSADDQRFIFSSGEALEAAAQPYWLSIEHWGTELTEILGPEER